MDKELIEMCDTPEIQDRYFTLTRKCPFNNESHCDPMDCVDSCFNFKKGDYYWTNGFHIKRLTIALTYEGESSVEAADENDDCRLMRIGDPEYFTPSEWTHIFIPHETERIAEWLKGKRYTVNHLANGLLEIGNILDTPIKALLKAYMYLEHSKAWDGETWEPTNTPVMEG